VTERDRTNQNVPYVGASERRDRTSRMMEGDRGSQGRNSRDLDRRPLVTVESDAIKRIITRSDSAEELVREAERIGRALAHTLTTSQIRALFNEVRAIEAHWERDPVTAARRLVLLKPKMAYRSRPRSESARNSEAVKCIVDILTRAVDFVAGDADNFSRFIDFFEAILAYHRAAGGS